MAEGAQARQDKLWPITGWGERMHLARMRAGLTLDEVGKALGITGGAVSRWESENSYPSRKNLEEFARLVDVDASWLQFALSVRQVHDRRRVPMRNPWALEQGDIPVAAIECQYPCSPTAFAIEAFAEAVGSIRAGDILVIDPEVKPEYGDLVLVMAEQGPAIRIYWPQDAFGEMAKRFLDAVQSKLPKDTKERLRTLEIERIILKFRAEIPVSVKDSNVVATYEAVNAVRVVGVVIQHTRPRYSKIIHREVKPDTQVE